MATTIAEIRAGIKDRLATIDGLQTEAYLPASPRVPLAAIVPTDGTYNATMGGAAGLFPVELDVLIIAAPVNNYPAGQEILDKYLGPDGDLSIYAAIMADQTLDGIVDTVNITGFSGYGEVEGGNQSFWAARIHLEVYP